LCTLRASLIKLLKTLPKKMNYTYFKSTFTVLLTLFAFASKSQNLDILQSDSVQNAKIGNPVPYFKALAVDNKNLLLFEPIDLCGKVTLLEIWNSKSQSTRNTLKHHEALKKAFQDKLEVIFLTDESLSVVEDYARKNPSNTFFAISSDNNFSKSFPHATMPHSILIDADGYVRAITYPEQVTADVINKLLQNEAISLKIKDEVLAENDAVKNEKVIEPLYKSIILPYDHHKNIRFEWLDANELVFNNFSVPAVYQSLYGYSAVRTIIESPRAEDYRKNHNTFINFELKIPNFNKKEMAKEGISELHKALTLKSKIEYRTRKGYRLVNINETMASNNTHQLSTAEIESKNELINDKLVPNGLSIRTLKDFVNIIEMYDLVDAPITNKSSFTLEMPISFEELPKTKESLNSQLRKYGFVLLETEFTTEYLVLYE
jgi:hypothetical protein